MAIEDSTQETWRPIVGYETAYAVSSAGRIRCLVRRQGVRPDGLRRLELRRDGYTYVGFTSNGMKRVFSVHGIVAAAFLGDRPDGQQVNHKNGKKDDNRLENLEYVTISENALHSLHVLGRMATHARGETHGMAILTEITVREARHLGVTGLSERKIAKRLGVSRGTIRQAISGATWTHVR